MSQGGALPRVAVVHSDYNHRVNRVGGILIHQSEARVIERSNVMGMKSVSRRMLLKAGPCTLAAAAGIPPMAGAHAAAGLNPTSDAIIRRWYAAWEQKDWYPVDVMLADDFTFSSAAGDDHISKSAFKAQCWETQKDFIERFDLLRVYGSGNEAFVLYVCHTPNGKTFRNVEYLRLRGGQLEAIECYFGAQSSFPSAVSAEQS